MLMLRTQLVDLPPVSTTAAALPKTVKLIDLNDSSEWRIYSSPSMAIAVLHSSRGASRYILVEPWPLRLNMAGLSRYDLSRSCHQICSLDQVMITFHTYLQYGKSSSVREAHRQSWTVPR